MAVSISNLTNDGATGSITSQATASISPSSNNLLILTVISRTGITEDPNQPTATGNGLTWTVPTNGSIVYDSDSSSRKRITVFQALGASPSSGAITIDFGGQTQTDVIWSVDQASGVDTTTPVVQATNNKDEAQASGTLTVTLAAFGSTNNATFGSFTTDSANQDGAAGTGFTALVNTRLLPSGGNVQDFLTEWKTTNDTSVDATFGNSAGCKKGGIALEIKALTTVTRVGSMLTMFQ